MYQHTQFPYDKTAGTIAKLIHPKFSEKQKQTKFKCMFMDANKILPIHWPALTTVYKRNNFNNPQHDLPAATCHLLGNVQRIYL